MNVRDIVLFHQISFYVNANNIIKGYEPRNMLVLYHQVFYCTLTLI